jgi:hypothetical protein
MLIYWIAAFLGVGFDDMDFGFGFETDVDVDADVDVGADAEAEAEATAAEEGVETARHDSALTGFLKFINVGKVPFMLVLSTLKFFIWTGSLIITTLLHLYNWTSVFILIPLFIAAVFLTKYATNPLAKFLKKTGYQGEEEIDFLGRTGNMLSTIKDGKLGIAEFLVDKNPIKLNVISEKGNEIKYGEKVVIMNETKDKKVYYVVKDYSVEDIE